MGFVSRAAVASVFALLPGAAGQWMNKVTDAMVNQEEAASVSQLVAEAGGFSTETCGGSDDALQVEKIDVQTDGLAFVVRGHLSREVKGGTVRAQVRLEKPKGLSVSQHLKYVGATAFVRSRKFSEPLCEHLGLPGSNDDGACTLQPGAHDMRFSFKRLPKMVFVGKYILEINVVDEVGKAITCARGSLAVQTGKSKGIMRKLESGCPDLIMENLHIIESLHVTDVSECKEKGNMVNAEMRLKDGVDYTMIGHWRQICEDGGNTGMTVYKRHPEMWKLCSKQEECDFGCENVACQDDGEGTVKCVPTGETSCVEERYYEVSPQEVRDSCHEGGTPISGSATVATLRFGLAFIITLATFAALG